MALSANVKFVAMVMRHGARGPTSIYNFNRHIWNPEDVGQLTQNGRKQNFLLGTELRKRYVGDGKLLDSEHNPEQVYVLSSQINRTINSAKALFRGLYPAGNSPGLPFNPLEATPIQRIETIKENIDYSSLEIPSLQPIGINIIPRKTDSMFHGLKTCDRANQIKKQAKSLPEYKDKEKEMKQKLYPAISPLLKEDIDSISDAKKASSAIACDLAANAPNPLSDELYQQLDDLRNWWYYAALASTEEQLRLSSDTMLRELHKRLSDASTGASPTRFALYSGHDTSLIAYLSCLGSDIRKYPIFSSNWIIELLDDDTVRLKWNDAPMMIPGCPGQCKLDDFLAILSSKFVDDREKQCRIDQELEPSSGEEDNVLEDL